MSFDRLPAKIENILANKEARPTRVFVDLGSGVFPAAFVGNREFKDKDYYIGVEANKKNIETGIGGIVLNPDNLSRMNENVFFLNESVARRLPIPDESVDEVFLGNILGEYAINFIEPFLLQSYRVLKPGGDLIILEVITPDVAEDRSKAGLDKFVEQFGFERVRRIKWGEPGFKEEILKYSGHQIKRLSGGEFIVYFKKKNG